MKIGRIVAIGIVLLLGFGLPASAQMMGGGSEMMGGMTEMMSGEMHGAGPSSGCPAMSVQPVVFGDERPWLSFALAHSDEISLTADQVKGLTALRDDFQKEATRLVGEVRTAQGDLRRLYSQTPRDLRAVEAKVRAIAALEAELSIARVRTLEKGRTLLTAEQQQKLSTIAGGTGSTYRMPSRMHGMPS